MASYHFNASIISRGNGGSVTAADAYISGEKLRDKYDGKIHDRSYRKDVVHKEILLPLIAPQELLDRQTFLDALNLSERRSDSQMARTIKIALPNELSLEAQISLAKEFAMENFTKLGMCADTAIHEGVLDTSRKPFQLRRYVSARTTPMPILLYITFQDCKPQSLKNNVCLSFQNCKVTSSEKKGIPFRTVGDNRFHQTKN